MACPTVKFNSHKLYLELERAISIGRRAVKVFLSSLSLIRGEFNTRVAIRSAQREVATYHGECDVIARLNREIEFDKNSIYILNNLQTRAEVSLSKINRIRDRN